MEIYYGDFERSQKKSNESFSESLKDEIYDFKVYFDLLQTHTYDVLGKIMDNELHAHERALFHCIIKNSHLIYSANKLVLSGDFGITRILFREIFEYLLIGKYIYYNRRYAQSWLEKEKFDAKRQLWDRLQSPNPGNLRALWNLLCNQAHSKANSVQIGISGNDYEEVLISFKMNLLMLRLNKHLMELFVSLAFEIWPVAFRNAESLRECNDDVTMRYQEKVENNFIQEGLQVIKDYCEVWFFRNPAMGGTEVGIRRNVNNRAEN